MLFLCIMSILDCLCDAHLFTLDFSAHEQISPSMISSNQLDFKAGETDLH